MWSLTVEAAERATAVVIASASCLTEHCAASHVTTRVTHGRLAAVPLAAKCGSPMFLKHRRAWLLCH